MPLSTFKRLAGTTSVVAAALFGSLLSTSAQALVSAPSFTSLTIFGDSLSDTGNTSFASGGYYPTESSAQPYFGGRYSNGQLWTELLATGLGLPGSANPLYLGGSNYAFAGARTDGNLPAPGTVPGVLFQTQALWGSSHPAAEATGLYVVVGGGNDMRDARSIAPGTSLLENSFRQLSAEAAVANLKNSLGLLAARGAKNVLVSNLPNLGLTPEAAYLGLSAASTDATNRFNLLMPSVMNFGMSLGLTMSFLDMAGTLQAVMANPLAYGITNTVAPCTGFNGSPNMAWTACAASVFSDGLHPSARAHQVIAGAAFDALGVTPVPEPQTVALMIAGLLLVGAARRRAA